MKVLITSGPTREPIDSVRFISNFSSGETGRILADHFYEQGYEVVSLYGQGSARSKKIQRVLKFDNFNNLNFLLQKILSEEKFDFVIHLAAVSDYSPKEMVTGKIESGAEDLKLTFKKNFKILDRIKSYALKNREAPFVVGFKLTDNPDKKAWIENVSSIYARGQVDLVVHNDLSEYSETVTSHKFRIIDKDMNSVECETTFALGEELSKVFRRIK